MATASLNAVYVHEAKMAFLIRIAQTRLGAERLLASRLLSVLAQCDFFDARPDNSQSAIGLSNPFLHIRPHIHSVTRCGCFLLTCVGAVAPACEASTPTRR
jgi:Nuclear pore complex scaffold, nucleoporins 186/192/205